MITTGGSEALQFAINSCLDQGDEIIIPEPFYANYNGFSIASGVKIKPITTSIENGFALPEIREFEKLITARTKAILICNPGNPTGYLYSKEELETLRDIVVKHDLFLFALYFIVVPRYDLVMLVKVNFRQERCDKCGSR